MFKQFLIFFLAAVCGALIRGLLDDLLTVKKIIIPVLFFVVTAYFISKNPENGVHALTGLLVGHYFKLEIEIK